jgi:hypothetical protein
VEADDDVRSPSSCGKCGAGHVSEVAPEARHHPLPPARPADGYPSDEDSVAELPRHDVLRVALVAWLTDDGLHLVTFFG